MDEQETLSVSFMTSVTVPVLSQQRFSELTGIAPGVLTGWVNRGYIPVIKLGKHTLINMVLLTQDCIDQAQK